MSSPSAPHIFTLTGNLLAERTLTFDAWMAGKTQRASREDFQVGGKGINVSKMLNRLGAPNTALCFAGGTAGAECETWLRERNFNFKAFAARGATRVGVVIRSSTQPETTFLAPDVAPDAAAVRACVEFLAAQPDGSVLALCGSFPGWATTAFDPLRLALQRWLIRGHVVADVYGPPLAWLVDQPIALVKINADEFGPLASGLAQLPASMRAERWIVTNGPGPVQLRDRDRTVVLATPPVVHEVSATGSGDVFFACVLEALYRRGMSMADAVSFALPYAAANAAHPGVAEFPEPVA
jgi:1-phosphofructokinase